MRCIYSWLPGFAWELTVPSRFPYDKKTKCSVSNSSPRREVNAYLHWNELSETSTHAFVCVCVCNTVHWRVYQEGNAASTCTDHRWWGDSSISPATQQPQEGLWTRLYLCMLYVFCLMVLRRNHTPTLCNQEEQDDGILEAVRNSKNTDAFWAEH